MDLNSENLRIVSDRTIRRRAARSANQAIHEIVAQAYSAEDNRPSREHRPLQEDVTELFQDSEDSDVSVSGNEDANTPFTEYGEWNDSSSIDSSSEEDEFELQENYLVAEEKTTSKGD